MLITVDKGGITTRNLNAVQTEQNIHVKTGWKKKIEMTRKR